MLTDTGLADFSSLRSAQDTLSVGEKSQWLIVVDEMQKFAARRLSEGMPVRTVVLEICEILNERWFMQRNLVLHGDAGPVIAQWLYIGDLVGMEKHFFAGRWVSLYYVRNSYAIADQGKGGRVAVAEPNHTIVVDLDKCEKELSAGWSFNIKYSVRPITPQTTVQDRVLIKLARVICESYNSSSYVNAQMTHIIREELFHAVDFIYLESDIGQAAYWNWTPDSRRRFSETQLSAGGLLRTSFDSAMNGIALAPAEQLPPGASREGFSNFFKDSVNEISAQLGRAITDPDIVISLAGWSLNFMNKPRTPHITAAIVITYLLARELGIMDKSQRGNILVNGDNTVAASAMERIIDMPQERIKEAIRNIYNREFTHQLSDSMVLDSIRLNNALRSI